MSGETSRNQLEASEVPDQLRVQTPAQMLATLRKESAKRKAAAAKAAMPYSDDLFVGSELTYLDKHDVFSPGLSSLRRFFSSPAPEESVVVTHPMSVQSQVVRYQRPRTNQDPYVATYTPLPHIGEEQARKLMEKGFSNSSNVALDISLQSHVPQGTPLMAMCAVMDSRTEDPNEALQVAGYFDLGRDRCELITLPLVNFPLNKEDFDDYLRGLYLCTLFHNVRGFQDNTALCSYSAVGFDQHRQTPRCIRSRVRTSWEEILARNNKSDRTRVISGQNLLNIVEKDSNEAIPDLMKHSFRCIPPSRGFPQTTLLTSEGDLKRPSILARSISTRFTIPLNMSYTGRESFSRGRNSVGASTSCSRQDPDLLEGQGPDLDFSQIVFPTVVEKNFLNPKYEVTTTLKELYGDSFETLEVSTPHSYGGEKLKGKVFYSNHLTFQRDDLVAGKILASFNLSEVFSSPNLGSLLFSEIMSGFATLRVTVKVLLNKYTAFALKILYDELGQVNVNETDFNKISVLPGAIFSSQEEQFSFDFELFTPGVAINFKANEGFGRIDLAALSSCNLTEHMPDSFGCTFNFSVVDISTTFYNLGESNLLEVPNFPVHLTNETQGMMVSATPIVKVFHLNLYKEGSFFNKFQSLLNHLEGYSGDLVVDWLITASALTNGRVYILPIFDNNNFETFSEEKLLQCGYSAKQTSLDRRGVVHLPFNSWYGSYTRNKYPSLAFYFPDGVCGPVGETVHITVNIARVLNLLGVGHRLFKELSLEGQGPNLYSYYLHYLHCGNVQDAWLNKGGLWCVPVSPLNLAAHHLVGDKIKFNTDFVTKTRNWLHSAAASSAYWRGSLTYQLRVTFDKRSSANRKLVAFYTTHNQGLFGYTRACVGNTGISSTIGDTFSVDITIPFMKPTMWLQTYRVKFDYSTSTNGCVYFQLPTKGATSVQLWVRANHDLNCTRFRLNSTSLT
ncbi:polyprotein [Currant latent virus]|uniref:Polyprotein n=1 Tax=Currant latent virus TaxID=1476584 RepID=A0A0U2SLQ4_9SECO|nr:polyprotein [Currant latent virus]ALT45951.1 polyprotein [Currant latent virus]